ncbi:hypothetical protein V8D89_004131 [Ganoderma adspersum]
MGSAGIPLSERVEKVRAYREAWQTPTVVFDTRFPQRPDQLKLIRITGGVLPFVTGPHTLNLWKPGSSLRGVPEVRVSCGGALLHIRYSSISVDPAQDLVVVTTEAWHPGMFGVGEYRVHLLTTADIPHPFAALPELRGPGDTNPGQILVWNWKTGDVLLRLTPYVPDSCFKFLDESHLLVLFDQDVRIYDFPGQSTSGIQDQDPPAAPLTIDDCPCVLRLPPFAHEAVHVLDPKLHMPSSPSTSSTVAPPPFRHDPARRVVCVAFSLLSTARVEPLDRPFEHYMFLAPASALLSHFHRVCGGSGDRENAPAPVPRGDVPWEEWGPPSCRVCRVPSLDPRSTGVCGTKVVLSRRLGSDADADGRCAGMQVQVVDINPCVATRSNIPNGASVLRTDADDPERDDVDIVKCRFFRGGSVRSELPYTTATHEVCLELEDGAQRNDGRHELFVFEDQWTFLYVEPERDGAPTQFTATWVHWMEV